ncbi:hypothetical protein A2Z33_03460 [Candidatus Gottesmanbacteria bacterium RBG_16_52_11]|uniref:Thioredoxin domain-containing protein n=1 Tax=Candidatus Gottesmanbacteria bacterium RBG_16_52_11 TaxID=1798374 RepID=A0A1F5YVW4_9BACT|nr:MAG: hypothetical protein A2Z33_03460 [Candidatus Gottesmanbacteria bacterium RBG_16_52_11]
MPVGTTVTGSASASAYLVEFSDYQCPACKAWEPTVTEIISAYGDRMQFAYRHFPLDQHQVADTAARAAEAAGLQGKFWEMHSLLFGNQERMSDTIFAELAAQLSLDNDRFQNDMNSAAVREKIGRDRGDGIKFGVDSTPSFYLNGRKLELKEFDDLKKAVSQAVK